eukprot:CAMPEP_0172432190 /NCGR_PEP_ID=MMETSP1064-20121228/61951_1 /TAXON_ID=202472 /ORGANISM="Aulacoseira subarctica , Strain CCAP 1002/5" /LENGTH=75 /DNA_ID=CAMNT_0013179313 /DNA_START=88 /DNA_END=311 /DNA_ORIENTATION=+
MPSPDTDAEGGKGTPWYRCNKTEQYDVPGMDALLSKSRRGEPELAPWSSESDDDDDEARNEDMIDEAIDKLFSQV